MRKVEFIKGFAIKKKGDKGTYDGAFASRLVRILKVAKFVKDKK